MRHRNCGPLLVLFGKTISSSCFCLLLRIMSPYGLLSLKIRGILTMCLLLRRTSRPPICWRLIRLPVLGMCTTRVKTLGCRWFNLRRNFIRINSMVVAFLATSLSWFSRFLQRFISEGGRTITSRCNSWPDFCRKRFRPNLSWWRTRQGSLRLPDEDSWRALSTVNEPVRQLKAEFMYCILLFWSGRGWNCHRYHLSIKT